MLLVASFALFATPMWSAKSWVEVHNRPTWKLPQQRQAIAFWIKGLDRPQGLLLAPKTIMRTTPIVTSEVRVVLPRDFYLVEYDLNSQFAKDRLLLAGFADGAASPTPAELTPALDRLDVGTICVYNGNQYARDTAPQLGYQEFAKRKAPGRDDLLPAGRLSASPAPGARPRGRVGRAPVRNFARNGAGYPSDTELSSRVKVAVTRSRPRLSRCATGE